MELALYLALAGVGAAFVVYGVTWLADAWWLWCAPRERYGELGALWGRTADRRRRVRLGDVPEEKDDRAMSAGAAVDLATGRFRPKRSYSAAQIDSILRR